jgi:hypothetical protein
MKWSFVIQQKLKAALLLTGIMTVIIFTTLVLKNNIRGIDQSSNSIYQDRLIPAVSIVYLSENLYSKRLLIKKYISTEKVASSVEIREQLNAYNVAIDSLIRDFEKTYLVQDESKSLHAFKRCHHAYSRLEQQVIQFHEQGNKLAENELFDGQSSVTFQQGIAHLNELISIQSVVGQKLIKESQSEASQVNILSTLQIAVAIIIGLVILGLIHSAKLVDQDSQPFHLN